MTTVLLIAILVLLLAVLALLLTGWPGRAEKVVGETGRELRRELAQQRAVSVQLLHAMRIELDESLRETLEQKLDSLAALSGKHGSRRKKNDQSEQQNPPVASAQGADGDQERELLGSSNGKVSGQGQVNRQFLLFSALSHHDEPRVPEVMSVVAEGDDLPDIDEL